MPGPIELVQVQGDEQVAVARELFREYAGAIGVDLEYQGFAAELASLHAPYVPPHGALIVAQVDCATAACVALRCLDEATGEMKRLFVRPAYRSLGLGQCLIEAVVKAARGAGYTALRLDTLPSMAGAQALYRKLGFVEIPAYNTTHLPGTRFFELELGA